MDPQTQAILLEYLGAQLGRSLKKPADLNSVSSRELLEVLEDIPDEVLPLIVVLAKEGGSEGRIFEKLMGDHDPELQELSNRFFGRYESMILDEEEENALLAYLPPETWVDLGYIQSRQQFFLRQTMADIHDFLKFHFTEIPDFQPGEEETAWNWFFQKILLHP